VAQASVQIDDPAFTALGKAVTELNILRGTIVKVNGHPVHFQGTIGDPEFQLTNFILPVAKVDHIPVDPESHILITQEEPFTGRFNGCFGTTEAKKAKT